MGLQIKPASWPTSPSLQLSLGELTEDAVSLRDRVGTGSCISNDLMVPEEGSAKLHVCY